MEEIERILELFDKLNDEQKQLAYKKILELLVQLMMMESDSAGHNRD